MNAFPDIPAFLDRRPLIWSFSMLHCFRDICPHQGQARYIDKSIKFVETPAIKEGNFGHTAFEQRVGGCSDMGRATTVKYNYPGFSYSINGVYRFIGLDEVEVWEPDLPERTPENAAMFGGREVVAVDGVEVGVGGA